jgi:adenine-specific DNA methylase
MDYIGSKKQLLNWIFSAIPFKGIFCDGCGGSGVVSLEACKRGFDVISNDLMTFSTTIVEGFTNISLQELQVAKNHIVTINNLEPFDGFFYKNYSQDAGRLYFSNENAKRIDACRRFISTIDNKNIATYLLACSLNSISAVSNTAGVQAAFLKNLKQRALEKFIVREHGIVICNKVITYNRPIEELVSDIVCDSL